MSCDYGQYGEHSHGGGCPRHRGFAISARPDAGALEALSGDFYELGTPSFGGGDGSLDCFDAVKNVGITFHMRRAATPDERALAKEICEALHLP